MSNPGTVIALTPEEEANKDLLEALENEPAPERESQSSAIVRMIEETFNLFHDQNKDVFAQNKVSGEVYAINSRSFKDCIVARFYDETKKAARDQSLREALITVSGMGRHSGELRTVNLRTAHGGGTYCLDLCIPGNSSAVIVRPGKWLTVDKPEALFIRPESMQPLPVPVPGASLELLWSICNIPQSQRLLVTTWLIECLRPETPFPILELIGEQGSAKSTTQRNLRRVIDPNACDLRAAPKCVDDIFVSAGVCAVVSYENLSHLPPAMQDALCILATGGGHAKRKLYSDADETIIHVKRPVVINSIVVVITQQDAVDRAVSVDLPVIHDRVEVSNIADRFEELHPRILGALLDVFADALTHLPSVMIPAKYRPRLIEFARLGIAVEKAVNAQPGEFMRQFNTARQEALARTLDASPVASAVLDFIASEPDGIAAPVKQIMTHLEPHKPSGNDSWPRSPKGLGDALRRAAPALRQTGIECQYLGKVGGSVKWSIKRKLSEPSPDCPEVLPDSIEQQDIRTCRTSDQLLSSGEWGNDL